MTAAGVGSLLICKRQLQRFREAKRADSPLLTPLGTPNSSQKYEVSTSFVQIDQAVKKGMAWLSANFTTTEPRLIGQSVYYCLYGIERIAALADRQTIGKVDLVEQARAYIRSTQKPSGCWSVPAFTDDVSTVWAMLFLTKSTAKSIKRVAFKRLGAGTLVGGRYLPSDLTSMTVAGGKVMSRPMNGAVEGMLAVLEDPRANGRDGRIWPDRARHRAKGLTRCARSRIGFAGYWPTGIPGCVRWLPGRWHGLPISTWSPT